MYGNGNNKRKEGDYTKHEPHAGSKIPPCRSPAGMSAHALQCHGWHPMPTRPIMWQTCSRRQQNGYDSVWLNHIAHKRKNLAMQSAYGARMHVTGGLFCLLELFAPQQQETSFGARQCRDSIGTYCFACCSRVVHSRFTVGSTRRHLPRTVCSRRVRLRVACVFAFWDYLRFTCGLPLARLWTSLQLWLTCGALAAHLQFHRGALADRMRLT